MTLVLVFTLLFGWLGAAAAQEPPPAIDPEVRMELLEKQNEVLRRQNAVLQQKVRLENQVKQQVQALEQEVQEIQKLDEEVQQRFSELLEGHDGWALNSKLEWVRVKEDGGG